MAAGNAPGLLALMAAQFGVHAAGWAMAAAMQRRAGGTEGHFALFWALLAGALALYLLPLAALHVVGDWLLLAATLALHRGVLRFYHQAPPDRLYLLAAVVVAIALALAMLQPEPLPWRLAVLAAAPPLGFAALAVSFWRHNTRRSHRLWASAVAAKALLFALLALAALQGRQPLDGHLVIGLFFVAGLFNLVQVRLVLGRVLRHLLAQTQIDPLTGAANRRGFLAALEREHARALRGGRPYALLMIDIDHFKRINDERGHAAGDLALRQVAQVLLDGVRGGDAVGRLGGEEFCVLMPASDAAGASGLAERLCRAVAAAQGLTVSVGVALVDPAHEAAEAALARADAALYRAKSEGRNRVVVAAAAAVKALPTC